MLEALRQPLEDGVVTIARINAQASYPARFVLICSMNPCPCGNYGSGTRPAAARPPRSGGILSRISGPLLDRIDMHIEVESIPADQLASMEESESSESIRARVCAAREVQRARYAKEKGDIRCNAQLDARTIARACAMTPEAHELTLLSCERLKLSNRAYTRILKVARTIADLDGADEISAEHVSEAVQYRTLDRKYWG